MNSTSALAAKILTILLLTVPYGLPQGNGRDAVMEGHFKGLPADEGVFPVHPGDLARVHVASTQGSLIGANLIIAGELRDHSSPPYIQLAGEPGALIVSRDYLALIDDFNGYGIGGLPAGGFTLTFPVPNTPNRDLHLQAAVEDPAAPNGLAITEGSQAAIHDSAIITANFGPAQAGAEFGYSVTTHDLDGDGRDEMIAGARYEDTAPGASVGRVRIYRNGQSVPWKVLDDPETPAAANGNMFGVSTAVDDFNADGFPDVVVGARRADLAGPQRSGKAVVYFGPDYTVTRTLLPPLPEAGGRFGHRMASGDFDGDGFADLAVSSINADTLSGIVDAGVVDIFYGPLGWATQRLESPTPEAGAEFGYRLETADSNGDGFDELLVASPFHSLTPGGLDASGYIHVLEGPQFAVVLDFPNPFPSDLGLLGADVAFKDVDGDGIEDVVAGAELDDVTLNNQGSVWIVNGPDFTVSSRVVATDPAVDGGFGSGVDVGDFDGDGHADLVVGEFWRQDVATRQGRVQVLYGPSFTTSDSFFEPNAGSQRQFGRRTRAFDLDGDGVDEIVTSAPFSSASGFTNSGAVYTIEL